MTDLALIDWPKVARNVRRHCQARDLAGVMAWVTLGKLARGDIIEPSFSQGVRLLNMHLDACPKEHTPANLFTGVPAGTGRARRAA